jgi:hypothetical protein
MVFQWPFTRRARTQATPARTLAPSLLPDAALLARVAALEDTLHQLHRSEAIRSAEHAAMVDKLDRLYKRVAARVARGENGATDESTLAMRNRLRGL